MNKEFLLNILFLLAVNLLIKPLYVFGVDLKVQNEVVNYGLYSALLNFSYIFQIFSDLGIHQYNNRQVAQHEYLFGKYFPHLLSLKGGLSIVFMLLSLVTAIAIGYRGQALYLLSFLLLNQIFITLTFFFRSNLSGLQQYRLDSFLSVLDKLLMLLLALPLLWGPWAVVFQIEYLVYIQSIAFGITSLVAFLACRRFVGQRLRLRWNLSLLYAILKQSLPFSLVVLLMSIYTRMDAIMIERLLSDPNFSQSNRYAAAYRLLDAVNMVGYLFAGLLLPMFARMLQHKKDIVPLLSLSVRMMLVVTFSFSIAVCFNATPILQMLYKAYHPEMVPLLILLLIGFNAIGVIHIVGTLLTANGNLKALNSVFVVGIFLNLTSNYFLILKYGAWGAAFSTLLTQSFVAIAELWLARQYFKLAWSKAFWLQVSLFIIGVLVLNYLLIASQLAWGLCFVGAGLLSVGWAFVTQLLQPKRILSTFKTKDF
ncbi:MAG: oligosaccharide flippase family protein [Aureispira sp.]